MNRSSYSATDELSLCQDRITSIFSLIELILNVYKNSITQFFFLAGKRKLISFQQLTFWHLIKSLHDLWLVLFDKTGMGLCW